MKGWGIARVVGKDIWNDFLSTSGASELKHFGHSDNSLVDMLDDALFGSIDKKKQGSMKSSSHEEKVVREFFKL